MKGLENIIDKILNDAKEEAEKIINEAEIEKEKILKESNEKSKAEVDKIISRAELEKKNILSRAHSTKELNARDKILIAKQDRIESVLDEVLEKLKNLSDEDFVKYVKNNISDIDINKEAVLKVPSRYKDAVEKANLGFKISNEEVDEGFELNYKNLRYNGDFKQIIDSKREDLEGFLAEKLFN